VRPSTNLRFHKVAPEPKQLPTPALDYGLNNQGTGVRFTAVAETFFFVSKLTLGSTYCPVEGYIGFIPGFLSRGWSRLLVSIWGWWQEGMDLYIWFQVCYFYIRITFYLMYSFSDLYILICPFCVSIQTTVEACVMLLLMSNCHVLLFRLLPFFFFFCLSHFTSLFMCENSMVLGKPDSLCSLLRNR
jgi:hypothetical protein